METLYTITCESYTDDYAEKDYRSETVYCTDKQTAYAHAVYFWSTNLWFTNEGISAEDLASFMERLEELQKDPKNAEEIHSLFTENASALYQPHYGSPNEPTCNVTVSTLEDIDERSLEDVWNDAVHYYNSQKEDCYSL